MRRLAERITPTKTLWSVVVALGILFPVTARGQGAPGPREYHNTPVNAGTFFADFLYNKTQTASSSNLPAPNNETFSRVRVVTALYSFPLGSRYGGVGLTGGYTGVQGTGPNGDIKGSGFIDPGISFHANFFGAPALRKDEFAEKTPTTSSGLHFTVNAPLGSYDRNSPVNTGANRWAFYPLVNLSMTRDKGVSWIELYGGARFFTNNNEFQGNNQLSQKPLAVLAAHYSHNIGKKWFAGAGLYYDNGGETSVNNVPQGNAANGFRPGVTISRKVWRYRVTVRYELTASTPHAAPTNGLVLLRLSGPLF